MKEPVKYIAFSNHCAEFSCTEFLVLDVDMTKGSHAPRIDKRSFLCGLAKSGVTLEKLAVNTRNIIRLSDCD